MRMYNWQPEPNYIARAIELMEQNVERGRFPYASLLVHDGKILHEASNLVPIPLSRDELPIRESPLAHPELAICDWVNTYVEEKFPGKRIPQLKLLSHMILYTSCEPCAMCIRAMAGAGLLNVAFVVSRKNAESRQSFGFNSEPNTKVVEREYGLVLDSRGPIEESRALPTLFKVWDGVLSLSKAG